MEGSRRKMSRGLSPERPARSTAAPPVGRNRAAVAAVRRVQVVYYLSRNGQLEHPHFMELSILPNHHLRLKDVMDKLTALRGKGMPSLFSWSCKRSYKNGYVWNDLSENDVIHPADGGGEYVLKGSEIIHSGLSVRFQKTQPTRSFPARIQVEVAEDVEEEEMQSKSGKLPITSPEHGAAAVYRCSRGVSTEEEHNRSCTRKHTELALDDSSPPSSSSSDKRGGGGGGGGGGSQRFEDGDPVQLGGRSSVLLQLISCGGSTPPAKVSAARSGEGRRSGGLHRGVLNRLVMNRTATEEEDEMRFVKEDKEYFSGSIIECITGSSRNATADDVLPSPAAIKRSNSHNEERSSSSNIGLGNGQEEKSEAKGKCIPGRKKTTSSRK